MSSVPDREEIDERHKWDLDSLFASDGAWVEAFEEARERLDDLRAYEGRATENAATLRDLLEGVADDSLRSHVLNKSHRTVPVAAVSPSDVRGIRTVDVQTDLLML